MSSEEIEPDAYSFERYIKMKTDSVTVYSPKHPDEWIDEVEEDVSIVPESIDKLFSAETIQDKAESFCDKLDYQAKNNLSDSEKQRLEDVKSEIRKFAEVFSSDEQ